MDFSTFWDDNFSFHTTSSDFVWPIHSGSELIAERLHLGLNLPSATIDWFL